MGGSSGRVVGRIVVRGEAGQDADPLVDQEDGLLVGTRFHSGKKLLTPGTIYEIVEVDRGFRLYRVGQSSITNQGRVNWTQPLNEVLNNAGPAVVLTAEEVADIEAAEQEEKRERELAAFKKKADWKSRFDAPPDVQGPTDGADWGAIKQGDLDQLNRLVPGGADVPVAATAPFRPEDVQLTYAAAEDWGFIRLHDAVVVDGVLVKNRYGLVGGRVPPGAKTLADVLPPDDDHDVS